MSFAKIYKEHITANGGQPELYVDGKKTVPLWYALSTFPAARPWNTCSQEGIKNFSDCGIDIVCVCTNLYEGWQENGEYNPEAMYRDIFEVLAANPNAKIVTRLQVSPPYWWLRKYPEEQVVFYGKRTVDGQEKFVKIESTDRGYYGDYIFDRTVPTEEIKASIASDRFLHDCGEILKQLCKKVKEHPLGQHLIGIQVAYGALGEWHGWSKYDGVSCESDFSEPMQKLFRRIVKERYQTEEELQHFYGVGTTFENVEMATLEEQQVYKKVDENEKGDFLVPEKYARVIDSQRCYSHATANAISYFCKCVKEAWGKGILAGAFYGYQFFTMDAGAAHFEPHKLFTDENIDFLAGPCAYDFNKNSGNANMIRYVAESCRLNGKLYLCEMDQGFAGWNMRIKGPYVCENEAEYASIMKRNIMENILLGHGAWYFDHKLPTESLYEKEGCWNQPDRLKTVAQIQAACEKIQEKEYKKTTDVLLVVDTETRYYMKYDACKFPLLNAIGKSGVGFDRLYLKDIDKCDINRYKCVLFLHCRVMEKKIYDYVRNKVMAGGRTVVFVNEFATVVDKETSENRLSEMIGVPLSTEYAEYAQENCLACVMPVAITNREFYHDLFKRTGAHIYTDNGEVVIADNEMVMVHSKDIPYTTLHLHCGDIRIKNEKYSTVVYNTFTGEKVL